MAEFRHLVYTLLILLVVLSGLSLLHTFTHAALYVLGFVVLAGLAYLWADRHTRRLR